MDDKELKLRIKSVLECVIGIQYPVDEQIFLQVQTFCHEVLKDVKANIDEKENDQ